MFFIGLKNDTEIEVLIDIDKISAIRKREGGTVVTLDNGKEIGTLVPIEDFQKAIRERVR